MPDGRNENLIFHLRMLAEEVLAVVQVVEGSHETVVMLHIGRQILDDNALELTEFLVRLTVMVGVGVDVGACLR